MPPSIEHDVETTAEGYLFRHKCLRCGEVRHTTKPNWKGACPGAPGFGDWLAGIFKRLGIGECGGCTKRKRWLNRIFRRGT